MKLGFKILVLTLALSSGAWSAKAASRVIQFSGTAAVAISGQSSDPGLPLEVVMHNDTVECHLAIVNTGMSDQKVTKLEYTNVTFSGGPNPSYRSVLANLPVGASTLLMPIPSTNPECVGAGAQAIPPGGICILNFRVSGIAQQSVQGVCAGRIRVEDADPSKPGSVVASGSLEIFQEAKVMGGVLSGAYFSSGSPIAYGTSNAAGGDVPFRNPVPIPGDQDPNMKFPYLNGMNLYCKRACLDSHNNLNYWSGRETSLRAEGTQNHWYECGTNQNPKDWWSSSCRKLALQSMCDSLCQAAVPTDLIMPSGRNIPLGIVGNRGVDTEGSNPLWAFGGSWKNKTGALTVDPQFAGGHSNHYKVSPAIAAGVVIEMQMGPFMSICSGNLEYASRGGAPFPHARGYKEIQDVQGIWATYSGGANKYRSAGGDPTGQIPPELKYPESLYCAHRHGRDDLYLRSGQSVPFNVNGGLPF